MWNFCFGDGVLYVFDWFGVLVVRFVVEVSSVKRIY